jgi:DNA (cytosine-5)-methyltransferase 1
MLAAAHLESYHAEKREGEERGADLLDPLATLDTSNRHVLVAAWLAKHFGGVVGSPLDQPKGTVTTIDHDSLVAAHIQRDFGASIGHAADEPMGTVISGGGGTAALVASFLSKYYGEGIGQEADAPAPTATTKDRLSLVIVLLKGIPHVLVDVAMRMLWPRELYLCQGFPHNYIIDRGLFVVKGKLVERKLTKTAQVRMVGNSVSPHPGAAIIRVNIPELIVRDEVLTRKPKPQRVRKAVAV